MGLKAAVGATLAISLLLGGCAGGAIEYVSKEYTNQEKDGWVDLAPGSEQSQIYNIWLHKQKPKVMVQTSLQAAATYGVAQGATYGAVSTAPVQPVFEQAALRWFDEQGRGPCRLSNPVRIHDIAWEFDYDCGLAAPTPGSGRSRRR